MFYRQKNKLYLCILLFASCISIDEKSYFPLYIHSSTLLFFQFSQNITSKKIPVERTELLIFIFDW